VPTVPEKKPSHIPVEPRADAPPMGRQMVDKRGNIQNGVPLWNPCAATQSPKICPPPKLGITPIGRKRGFLKRRWKPPKLLCPPPVENYICRTPGPSFTHPQTIKSGVFPILKWKPTAKRVEDLYEREWRRVINTALKS